jgi:hypothetical protein
MVIHPNDVFNDFVAAHRSASTSCGAVAATVSGAKRTHKYIGGHMAKRHTAAKRTLINTGTDKRYVRRSTRGRFSESDDVGRSSVQDRRRNAARKAKRGQGDKGDR